ncbi:MAG: pantoate--beta-alanine ligase [Bdellovibrionota bacterium]
MPKVLRTVDDIRHALAQHHARAEVIGFVPTMGALHEGHGMLLERCADECPVRVLSIFVNPTQFGPNEDFSIYPHTFDADVELARSKGVQYVFAPGVEEIYPENFSTFIDVAKVSEPLCGAFRAGHFRGVATVVHRLFQILHPQVAYFGQKDLQQCLVIDRMAKDLELSVKIAICPTVREADGLAKSSRNRYLSPDERRKSTVIFRAMDHVGKAFEGGERSVAALLEGARRVLAEVPEFKPQYSEIRSLPLLGEISVIEGPAAIAIAGFLGKTRLIDNLILT